MTDDTPPVDDVPQAPMDVAPELAPTTDDRAARESRAEGEASR